MRLGLWIVLGWIIISPAGALDKLPVISKAHWGGKPLADSADTRAYLQGIKYITIHHGGVFFADSTDPVAYLKHLQEFSTGEKKWMDIPYHFLIDPEGRIYAARPLKYAGDTNTEYDPHGHALICVIGNFEIQKPNEKQLTSMVDLTLALMKDYNVPAARVATHRDYSKKTVCPGKNLYRYFQEGWVESMLQSRSRFLGK